MLPDKNFFEDYAKKNNIPFQEKSILREYLQTQILRELSLSNYNDKLSFLGGTSLRFGYRINRFSEDLDFDLIDREDFNIELLSDELSRKIKLRGFNVDVKTKTTENIFIIYFKFREVLKEFGLSQLDDQKLSVKFEIDFSPYQNIKTDTIFVDNFNERFPLLFNTIETIFAQKLLAFFHRPYQKGRDFYDLIWFMAQRNLEPNYAILQEKGHKIENKEELVVEMKKNVSKLDLEKASKDVEPFLFYPNQAKWILDFNKHLDDFSKR